MTCAKPLMAASLMLALGCGSKPVKTKASSSAALESADAAEPAPPPPPARKPAPDFSLYDLEGDVVGLAELAGSRVVLDWFDPKCSHVQRAYRKELKNLGWEIEEDLVWLSIAPARTPKEVKAVKAAARKWRVSHQVLLDKDRVVTDSYDVRLAPYWIVIDSRGGIAYRGAWSDVDAALSSLSAGIPVEEEETTATGCAIKGAN